MAGTVDQKSGQYDPKTGTLSFSYTPYSSDAGGSGATIGRGFIGGVYPSGGGQSLIDALPIAGQIAENNIKTGALFMAQNAALEGAGQLAWLGVEALLASRAASPALKVVINWAHRLQDVRPGHLPPPGTQAEIQQAVEGAIQSGKYTTGAYGVVRGTTNIHGVEVGFQGKMVGGVMRISSVFTKQ